jgi:hypothetical protein
MGRAITFVLAVAAALVTAFLIAALTDHGLAWPLLGGVAACLVAAGILAFVEERRKRKRRAEDQLPASAPLVLPPLQVSGQGVASVYQSGGQTAHSIVNVGPQPRTLAGVDTRELVNYLKGFAGTEIVVSCALGNGEAAFFAEELKQLLEGAGWKVDGVNHSMMMPPQRQIQLRLTGADPAAHPWATGLGNRLIQLGFPCSGAMNAPALEIHIGQS